MENNSTGAFCVERRVSLQCIREHPTVKKWNTFLVSPYFVMTVGLLAAISNIFSLELPVYTCYILVGLYVSILGEDYLPMIPIVVCCYIAPSFDANPGRNEDSVFYPEHGGLYLLAIAVLFAASVVWRLATDKKMGGRNFLTAERKLLSGMLFLGAAYMLAGIGSGFYFEKGLPNVVFAAVQFLSVFAMYYFFTGGIRWERCRKDYFAWTGLGIGCAIVLELVNIYLFQDVVIDGIIIRESICTGWGIHNNIGALLVFTIPCAYYLACRRKHGGVYNLCGLAFLIGVLFTCSRSSILGGVVAYLASYGLVLIKAKNKRANHLAHLITLAAIAVVVILFHNEIYRLFLELVNKGLDPSHRDEIYLEGWKQFLKYPLSGATFYPVDYAPWGWSTVESFTSFFPPRWHNTLVQLGASCGLMGLVAYGFHRFQTVKLFTKQISLEKSYIAVSLAALLGMSLLDCHMFNIGPVLYYSIMLAFGEKCGAGIKVSMQ